MPLRIAKIWNYFDSAINLTELLLIFSNCNGYGSTIALSALIITRNAHFSSWLFEFFGWMLLYLLLKAKLQRNGKRQERRVRKNNQHCTFHNQECGVASKSRKEKQWRSQQDDCH